MDPRWKTLSPRNTRKNTEMPISSAAQHPPTPRLRRDRQLRPPCPILLRKLEGETVASRFYQLSFVWFALFDAKKSYQSVYSQDPRRRACLQLALFCLHIQRSVNAIRDNNKTPIWINPNFSVSVYNICSRVNRQVGDKSHMLQVFPAFTP